MQQGLTAGLGRANSAFRVFGLAGSILLISMGSAERVKSPSRWRLSEAAQALVEPSLAEQIFRALDAAERAGTDPAISGFHVRAATVAETEGRQQIVVGGNTEYQLPEAIHGETSLVNHVASLLGAGATRKLRFIAFYSAGSCGTSLSCGDCRDYLIATTDFENLLVACGQGSDHTVQLRRFAEAVVPEDRFPQVAPAELGLSESELRRLVDAAQEARRHGITLFTGSERHAGAAGLSSQGRLYWAAGADDAAFHYRYPIGGLLQQAAAAGDYFIQAIVVAGAPGAWPRVSYRDRQYGYESSSFNRRRGLEPIRLILTDGEGRYRTTSFEAALPYAFSTAAFMPQAVDRFLESQTGPATAPPPG